MPSSISNAVSTVTRIGGAIAVSSDVSVDPVSSVQESTEATTQATEAITSPTATVLDDAHTASTTLGNEVSLSSQISSSSASASPLPLKHEESKPSIGAAAIAGIAVGAAFLIAISLGTVFLILRRQKRDLPGKPRSMSPPTSDIGHEKIVCEEAELAGQEVQPQSSRPRVDAPVEILELDADSPVSPLWEPMQMSGTERRARIAQNF
ncbi:hypothetical protein OPT61_g3638 [Boeremia exigua]|uniref:Uncharacterized protein n=1 Tax=Boeremia exigua TaxID=749465 RepID=A0ACC2IH28_9PLEO|nr:hypothetical protein OPT61_g3638 [Boeremia exigua]